MKNWVRLTYGRWINGIEWEEAGYTYIDPAAVEAIQTSRCPVDYPEGCLLYMAKGNTFAVRESAEHVIAQIQSALP